MKYLVDGLAILTCTVLLIGCRSTTSQILVQAEAEWRRGDYQEAIRLNNSLYESDKEGQYSAQALLNIGNIYYINLRELDKAIEFFNKVVQERPEMPQAREARRALADIYAKEIGDFTQAIYEYDRLLETPDLENREETQYHRANAFFKKGDYDRALRELQRLEESVIEGHLADQVSLKIGNIYQIQKRFEDAAIEFNEALQSPCVECRRRAVISLMESFESLFEFDLAIETIKKLDPTPENNKRIEKEVNRLIEKQRRISSGEMIGSLRQEFEN